MSRQVERATARRQAKIDRANSAKANSYPASRDEPFQSRGKDYRALRKEASA